MSNYYPDGHNVGVGMAYDTPEEKQIAELEDTCQRLRGLAGELWKLALSDLDSDLVKEKYKQRFMQRLKDEGVPCD